MRKKQEHGTVSTKQAETAKETDANGKPPEKKEAPRTRVRNAQLKVLDELEKILTGNCKSATKGNHNCAKFVLDWSLISDLRSPLAKPARQKSLAGLLLKKLKLAADKQKKTDELKSAPEE
jgi:hypothetical protein